METIPPRKKAWFTIFWAKFRSQFKTKRPFRLTRPGWVFILYTIGVGAGAINTGNNLLYLIFGLFLGLIMASGALSDLSLWKLEAKVTFPSKGAVGQSLFIPIHLINKKKWFSSLSVRVVLDGDIEGDPVHVELYVSSLPAKGEFHGQFLWTPERRGLFQCRRIRFLTQFPFGLLVKWWTHLNLESAPEAVQLAYTSVISPEIFSISERYFFELEDFAAQQLPINKSGEGVVFRGIRPYTVSDHPRRIHWKASAKRSSLASSIESSWLIKEMEAEGKNSLQIDWVSMDEFGRLSAEEQEKLLSFVASLIHASQLDRLALLLRVNNSTGEELGVIDSSADQLSFLALFNLPSAQRKNFNRLSKKRPQSAAGVSVLDAYRQFMGGLPR